MLTTKTSKSVGLALLLGSQLLLATAVQAANWQPVASEKLIRMPANFLAKAVESDFQASSLASQIVDLNMAAAASGEAMAELKQAINHAEGDAKIALEHQFLDEKSRYLDIVQDREQLDRKALNTKINVYSQVLKAMRSSKAEANNPAVQDLLQQQQVAKQRFAKSIARVDDIVQTLSPASRSRYAKEYDENLGKIHELQTKINNHVANAAPQIDGAIVTREDYVRHLLADSEAGLALLDQENEMLGLMAKLVSLDAQALQHQLQAGTPMQDTTPTTTSRVANAVKFF